MTDIREINMGKRFIYDGVVSGKKVNSWTCPLIETVAEGKKKQEPDTAAPAAWWKKTYTRENGAFWYKVGETCE